jgi:hypothetical protein
LICTGQRFNDLRTLIGAIFNVMCEAITSPPTNAPATSTQELAADFRNMHASVAEEVPLLDRALDAVVKGLKRYSGGSAAKDDTLEITELHTL